MHILIFCYTPAVTIFRTPSKSRALELPLTELDEQRRYLARHLGESTQPWTGALRRLAAAEATVGSTSIEGYGASVEDTVEILAGRPAPGRSVSHGAPQPRFYSPVWRWQRTSRAGRSVVGTGKGRPAPSGVRVDRAISGSTHARVLRRSRRGTGARVRSGARRIGMG